MRRKLLVFFLLAFIFFYNGFCQTIINVDLSAKTDTTVTISSNRSGSYCGDNNCVVFVITLNPGSDLLNISGSQLSHSDNYTINCGPQTPVGVPTCVSGLTTANIAFCKPGNNTITYTITASTAVHASGDLILRQGCTGALSVTGLNTATVNWTSVYPGANGAYNSYLSCTSGCATTSVTPAAGAPAYIDYKVSGIVTNCANNKSDTVRVYTVPAMTVAITPVSPVICTGGSGNVVLTATPTGGNAPYTYLWSTGETTQSIAVNSVGTYSVSVGDNTNGCAAIPQSVTVTAAPVPVAPTAAGTTVCAGNTATLTATAPGGTYQWYDSPSGGILLATSTSYTTPTLSSTTTYYVQTTLGGCPSPRTAVMVTVNPTPAAPTAASISTCSGSSATLSATAPGGTYDWYDAASGGTLLATGSTFITPPLTVNTTYYVQTTVNGCSSSRTPVTVSIVPTPVAPTAAGTTTCSGTTVTLMATAPGGNYDWYDSAVGGTLLLSGATYTTPVLTSTTTYYVQTTLNGCISARTPVTVTVSPIPVAPTVTDAIICNGTTATLLATAPGGTYQWYDATSGGTLLGSGSTFITPTLTSSTTYYVETVINGCTSLRSAVNVTVNPITMAPTAPGATICSGSAAILTATAPGGTYDWFSVASGGISLFTGAVYTTPTLLATTTYYVEATINGCTGPRTAVIVTVTPTPVAPTAPGTAICAGNTATLTASAPGGAYDWYDNATGGTLLGSGATFTTPVLNGSTTYYVQTTVNGCISPRTAVNVTVNPTPAAPAVAGSTICQGSTAVLTATAPGGTYKWYTAASGGTPFFTGAVYTTPALTTSTTYYVEATSALGCAGPRTAVVVTVTPPVNPAFFYPSGTFCKTGTNPVPSIVSPSGGTFSSTPGLVFVDNHTGELNLSASATGTYLITFVTNTACAYSSSSSITITNAPDATFSYAGPYCQNQANPLPSFSAGSSAGIFSCPDPGLVFLNTSTGEINLLNSTPGTYTVTNNIAAAGGCAAVSATNTVTINPAATVNAGTDQVVCSGQTVTLSGTIGGGATSATWSGGTGSFADASSPVTTYTLGPGETSVTLTLTTNDPAGPCGAVSDQMTITVNPTPAITSAASASTCNNAAQNYTITSNVTGTTFTWSRAAVAGISNAAVSGQTGNTINEVLNNTTNATVSVVYTIIPQANGCTGPAFTYTLTVNPTPAITSTATASTCNNTAQSYTITSNVTGTTFIWSRAAVAGISNPAVSGQTGNVISENLVNTTAAPISVVYNIIPQANGCTGPAFTYTLTVNPTPVITSAASASTCNNTAQNYIITSNVTGTTFTWSRAAVAGISNAAVSGQTSNTINEALNNTTNAAVSVVYTIIPQANGCSGPAFTYTLTVNPTPAITSAASASTCNNTAQSYTITSNVAGTTYTWSRAAVAGISNAAVSGQTSNTINEALNNTTNAAVSVVYNIVPQANGCTGPALTYTLTVNPTPTVTSATSASTCNNTAQNYIITSNVTGTTFTWSRAAVAGISNAAVSGQTSNTINEALNNTTNAAVSVVYTIIPQANGCSGPAFTYTLTVNPTPAITSAASASTCNNTAQSYTITSNVPGTTYTWSRAAVAGISNAAVSGQTGNVINESLNNTTNAPVSVVYTIIPQANGCTGPAFTYTLTVNPTPAITSTATASTCNNTAQSYNITSNVTGTTFTWSRAAVAGISNAAVSGQTSNTINEALNNTTNAAVSVVYNIIPQANGCTSPAFTYTLTVNPTPTITSAATASTCNNTAQNYTITSNIAGTTYTWSRAAVAGISNAAVSGQTGNLISENLVNTTAAPVIVVYNIIPQANGCAGPAFTYTLTVNPTPTVTSAASASTCNNAAQNYTITSNVTGTTFTWSRAAVAGISNAAVSGQTGNLISENLVNTTAAPVIVVYNIIPQVNGCTGPAFTYTLTVNPTPTVTSAASASTCNNTAQNYIITSNVTGTTFTWSRAAVAGISNAAVSGQTSNTINEALNNTTNAAVSVVYTIIPQANGCSGPAFTYTLTVNPTPAITSAASASTCNNTAQSYTITSNVAGTTYTWSRAAVAGISNAAVSGQTGNLISENLVNTTAAPVIVVYNIIPQANGCTGPAFTYTLTVNPTPTVTSAASASTCNNTAQSYNITSNVTGTTFIWSRAAVAGISNPAVSGQTGNVISENLVNTTAAPVIVVYNIIPQANGCAGPAFTYTLTVNPTPAAPAVAGSTICQGSTAVLTATAPGGTYKWYTAASGGTPFFTGAVYTTPALTTSTTYYVEATSALGCAGPRTAVVVTVTPPVNPAFFYPSGTFCKTGTNPVPSIVSPSGGTFSSTPGLVFVDNHTGELNLSASATGTYLITFVTNTACAYSSSSSITITNAPDATFSYAGPYCQNQANPLPSFSAGSSAGIFSCPDPGLVFLNTSTGEINLLNSTPGTYTVTNNIAAAGGCAAVSATNTVTINPAATVNAGTDQVVCSGQTVTLSGTIGGGATSATWSGGTGSFADASSPVTTYTLGPGETSVTLTLTTNDPAGPCGAVSDQMTITVNPTPAITSAASASTCNNTARSYTITSNVTGTTFTWSRAAVAGISNAAVSGQTGNLISENLVNTTAAPVIVVYNIIPQANGCTGPAFTYTLTVNPTPTVTSAASASTCNNTAQSYNITSNVTGTTFIWSRAAVAGISNPAVSGQTGNVISENLVNTTAAPVIVVYNIIPQANGCAGPAFTYTLTVNPTPAAPAVAGSTICQGSTAVLTATAPGGTYKWYTAASGGTPFFTGAVYTTPALTTSTTYYVEATSALGCAGPRTAVVVTVTPPVNPAFFYPSGTFCKTGTNPVPSIVSPSGGTFSSTPGLVFVDNHTGELNLSASATGTYLITFVTNTACAYSSSSSITITNAPDATFSYAGPYCQNQANPLPSFSAGSSAGIFSCPDPGLVFLNTSTGEINLLNSTPGTYTVTNNIAAAGGCAAVSATNTVTINPAATVNAGTDQVVCSGQTVTLSGTIGGGATSATWSGGTGSFADASSPVTTYTLGPGETSVTLTLTTNDPAGPCGAVSDQMTITVNPTPAITSAASASTCNNTARSYTITSNVTGTTFTWSRAAVAGISNAAVSGQTGNLISENLVNTTAAPVIVVYNIIPQANGCTGPAFTYTLTVNPTPTVTSAASASTCNNTAQSYTITSNVTGTTFIWSRAAVAGISNPAVSGQTGNVISENLVNTTAAPISVVYNIIPQANGCTGPAFTYTLTVNPTPVITSAASASTCNNTAQNYIITSNVTGTIFTWSRAAVAGISNAAVSGQTSNIINEALVNTTAAPISVVYHIIPLANGCSGPAFTYTLTVNPTPTVTSATSASTCNNTAQNYTITSNVAGTTYTWSRAAVAGISNAAVSGQTGNTINEVLSNTTNTPVSVVYNITPQANGCSGPAFTYTLTVNPTPIITNSSLTQTVCSNSSSTIVALASNVSGATFQWTATATPKTTGFIASGTGNIPPQILLNTDIAPGTITYVVTPYYNGCPGTAINYVITVNPKPVTPVASSNSPVCQNYTLNLTATTIPGAIYSWTGPNGFTSSAQNPTVNNVSPAASGLYSVQVIVNGCTSDVGTVNVSILPTPAVSASNNGPLCSESTLKLTASTVAGATYSWTGPNGFTSSLQNPSIPNAGTTSAGTYSVNVTANGCTSVAATTTVVVNAIPDAPIAISNSPVCEGSTINLSVTSIPGMTYTWTGPNGFFSNLPNPSIPAANQANAGLYTVTAAAGNCAGAPTSVIVAVAATPINPTASNNSPVCVGYPITLTSSTFAGAVYKWTGPNGFSSALQNPVIDSAVPANAGTYTVSITAPGCSITASTTTSVIINPIPVPPAASSNSPVCIGNNLNLNASSVAGASYSWVGPNGFSSTLQNPIVSNVSASASGTYSVTIMVDGCTSTAATTNVVLTKPGVVSAGNDQVVCASNANVTFSGSIDAEIKNFVWTSNGTGTFLPSDTSLSGIYIPSAADIAAGRVALTLSATNNGGCTVSSSFKVTINPIPIVNTGGDKSMCITDPSVNIKGSIANAPTGNWTTSGTGVFAPSNTSINVNYIPSAADKINGSVKLTLTSTGNNCVPISDVMTLTIEKLPTITMPDNKYILQGESTVLNPVVTGTGLKYQWSPGAYLSSTTIRNPTVTGVETQVYKLSVTGLGGCVVEKQITVNVLKPITVPNTFTPNGDGVNDVWGIKELSDYPGAQVTIFNRYGTQIYYSKGYTIPWDGTYNGKALPFGTYYYIINLGIYGKVIAGYIALVR